MSNSSVLVDWRQLTLRPFSPVGRSAAGLSHGLVKAGVAVGAVAAGAVLVEAALIPGLAIGAAAVLAPGLVSGLFRRSPSRTNRNDAADTASRSLAAPAPATPTLPRFGIKRAVFKTITFRALVTTLDFTTNYIVLGQVATAAGLSAVSLVIGPIFYLVHETTWTYFGTQAEREAKSWGPTVDLGVLLGRQPADGTRRTLKINRAVAKTITFRTFATALDFMTIYVVVGDVGSAVILSASGFVLGPFVYLGHELVWDRFGGSKPPAPAAA